jgi:hypothetical protein
VQSVGAAAVVGAVLAARRAGLDATRLLTLIIGLGCCWMTALGPATESATYVLLAPTAAWLPLAGSVERHPIGLCIVWVMGYALLIASQTIVVLPPVWSRAILSLGPQPLAALLLLSGLLYAALTTSRQTAQSANNCRLWLVYSSNGTPS